ncbi:YtxH domain-containing protein [bacterium]|nr:YtxH domain-containing protein [bacterium]
MRDDRDSGLGFLGGVLVGAVVGAAVAIILAPDSGENTRTAIKGRANEYKDKLSMMGQEYKDKLSVMGQEYKERFARITTEYQRKMQDLMAEIRASREASKDSGAADEDIVPEELSVEACACAGIDNVCADMDSDEDTLTDEDSDEEEA